MVLGLLGLRGFSPFLVRSWSVLDPFCSLVLVLGSGSVRGSVLVPFVFRLWSVPVLVLPLVRSGPSSVLGPFRS